MHLLATNPFIEAYIEADWMGKLIFIALLFTSIASWTVLLYKVWMTKSAKEKSSSFYASLQKNKQNPLQIELPPAQKNALNPFLEIYIVLKKQTLSLLNKNRHFTNRDEEKSSPFLSRTDVDFVESHVYSTIALQVQNLEKQLFILSTSVTLAPFLGLLGTVWGILTTFSHMQSRAGSSNDMILSGLSLALSTTVVGLIVAIPALIGYNYLKHTIRDFQIDMENFSNEMIASIEMQYRQVDIR